MKWFLLLAMLASILRIAASAPRLYFQQPTRWRRLLVATVATALIAVQPAIFLEVVYFRPKREQEQRQAFANAWVDVENDNARSAMVDAVHQTALNLTILCALGRLAHLPAPASATNESVEQIADKLRKHEEALAATYRSLKVPPGPNEVRSSEPSMCQFADRLEGLSALEGVSVGTHTWHYPLANGEALELAVGTDRRLHFTRIVSQSERSPDTPPGQGSQTPN